MITIRVKQNRVTPDTYDLTFDETQLLIKQQANPEPVKKSKGVILAQKIVSLQEGVKDILFKEFLILKDIVSKYILSKGFLIHHLSLSLIAYFTTVILDKL